ncbi:hypothetical protein F4678DRAFT_59314 [Xylaria arbuscula]|nr:hypothetical protein F4678DRAFT_59314 [Xylaria arbuscula]
MQNSGIGRLQAALASVTNEVTVAAANLNFDFSLVKCEAPREYQSIGQSISPYRKTEAEGGSQHITARRLGALFEEICPRVPNLLSAFGARASEIVQDISTQTQQKVSENWIFSDYTGIDSTSLWAAATSSKAALPIYLLACMLARAWSDADATSLWVEIVAERRRAIATKYHSEEEIPFATAVAAAQAEITRDQLARWDASARAWLQTADTTMFRWKRQFMLIANNINTPINDTPQTFDSIVEAWTTALETMDKLVAGQPLAVSNGAVVLAISAWHIYPDMVVFSGNDGGKTIEMKDPRVHQGGVLSLGLTDASPRASQGVYWSLALAKHKFYGRAIEKNSKLNADENRLTFNELQLVVMGVILSKWKTPISSTHATLEFLQRFFSLLPWDKSVYTHQWIQMILSPATLFFQDETIATALISLGRRRNEFIKSPDPGPEKPFFGLTDMKVALELAKTPNNRIELLRRLASKIENLKNFEAYIVYQDNGYWYLATVFPIHTVRGKPIFGHETNHAEAAGNQTARMCHCRWTDGIKATSKAPPPESSFSVKSLPFTRSRTIIELVKPSRTLSFLFGDADNAAVFMIDGQYEAIRQTLVPSIQYNDILWGLEHHLFLSAEVLSFLNSRESAIIDHLLALAFVSEIYTSDTMDGAMISPRILLAPFDLELSHILAQNKTRDDYNVENTRGGNVEFLRKSSASTAVIAYFQSGIDVLSIREGSHFHGSRILGLSAGDSIFVPSKLLHDPCVYVPKYQFSRLLGNLGRPGLTILTAPEHPEAREIDPGCFRKMISEFDGERLDVFKSTSLHLSFTEWSKPLYTISGIGQRGSEAVHAEAVVSVRDCGSWVADISILAAFSHPAVQVLPTANKPCGHEHPSKPPAGAFSIETWDQILDCPAGILVTRSFNNWVARIAIVAVLAQHCTLKPMSIRICPENTCWSCIQPLANNVIYVY